MFSEGFVAQLAAKVIVQMHCTLRALRSTKVTRRTGMTPQSRNPHDACGHSTQAAVNDERTPSHDARLKNSVAPFFTQAQPPTHARSTTKAQIPGVGEKAFAT